MDFNHIEFDVFRNKTGLNMTLFGMISKEKKDKNPDKYENIRDYADVN